MKHTSSLLLSIICTTVFGVLISAHGATVTGGYEYADNIKTLQYVDGALTNIGRTAVTVACATPLTPGTRLTWAVRLPPQGSLTITTGRGRESLALVNRGEHLQWSHTSPEGHSHKRRPYATGTSDEQMLYWWENDTYTPRGRTSPSFALPPGLRDWNAYYQALQNVDIGQEWWPVAVELADGRLRWYLDDILLQDQEATAEIGGRKLQLRLGQGVALRPVNVRELGSARPGFYRVNLANRYNAAAPLEVTRGAPFEFGGIPFEAMPIREGGLGCVDLGASWFREGNLDSGDAPNRGTFGGRWAGALSANPTRIQFRVPNGRYDAIYLLASCAARPDRVNRVTAQFYRPGSGFPQNFVPAEPIATDGRQLSRTARVHVHGAVAPAPARELEEAPDQIPQAVLPGQRRAARVA